MGCERGTYARKGREARGKNASVCGDGSLGKQPSVCGLLNSEWNQAQFDTESRLPNEPEPVSELHFTPGTPFFLKGFVSYRF